MTAQELLQRYAAGEPLFKNADLRGVDLSSTDLRRICLYWGRFDGCSAGEHQPGRCRLTLCALRWRRLPLRQPDRQQSARVEDEGGEPLEQLSLIAPRRSLALCSNPCPLGVEERSSPSSPSTIPQQMQQRYPLKLSSQILIILLSLSRMQ